MGAEYDFKLVKKGQNAEEAPTILWYGSSTSRELLDILPYNRRKDEWRECSEEDFSEVIKIKKDEIHQIEESIREQEKEQKEYIKMMPCAMSMDAFNCIQESFDETKSNIEEYKEQIQCLKSIIHDFAFMNNIIDVTENKDYKIIRLYSD